MLPEESTSVPGRGPALMSFRGVTVSPACVGYPGHNKSKKMKTNDKYSGYVVEGSASC